MADGGDQIPAFTATYHGLRMAMARGMVQIVLEVPIDQSDHVLKVLDGLPNPAKPTAVGVARLVRDHLPPQPIDPPLSLAPPAPPEAPAGQGKRRWVDMAPSSRAAIVCGEILFQRYLFGIGHLSEPTEAAATEYVRQIAGGTRSNLGKPGYELQTAEWGAIERRYIQHVHGDRP